MPQRVPFPGMDLGAHFAIIWRRKWVTLGIALLISVAVVGVMETEHKTYQAVAQISVTPAASAQGNPSTSQADATFLASTYAQLATTRPVAAAAAAGSKLGISEPTAASRLTVTASTSVGFITATATGPTPSAAVALDGSLVASLLNTVSNQQAVTLKSQLAPVEARIATVQNELSKTSAVSDPSLSAALSSEYGALLQAATQRQLQPADQLTVVSSPAASPGPIAPKPTREGALAFVTALVLAAEGSVAIEIMSDRFPQANLDEEIMRVTGVPVLAHVPDGEGADMVEAFRTLRTNMMFMTQAEEVRTLAIVSLAPETGKSFVAVHLALAMAELGVAAALVDGDMRRPVLHQYAGIGRSPGLAEVLGGKDLSDSSVVYPGQENLLIIPAGTAIADPAGALSRRLQQRVLAHLGQARLVVLDTPAESVFPDAATIAAHSDGTILVVDASKSRRRPTQAMLNRLRQVGASPIGVVVNRSKTGPRSASYYASRQPD